MSTTEKLSGCPAAPRKIGVVIDLSVPFNTQLTAGVLDFLSQSGLDWSIQVAEVHHFLEPTASVPAFDGAIAMPPDNALLHQAEVPVVLVRGDAGVPEAPGDCIEISHRGVVRIAVEHLAGKGFKRIGMASFAHGPHRHWIASREGAFLESCAQLGLEANMFTPSPDAEGNHAAMLQELGAWLRQPGTPRAVVAANDFRALDVIESCRLAGLSVPQDVALTGIDNHPIICPFSTPPLTSIGINYRRIGYLAAELLAARLRDPSAPRRCVDFTDFILFERDSTEATAVGDPLVAQALHLIHERFSESIGAREIHTALGTSHTTLNRRFRTALHCTVQECLQRERLRRAKALLADPKKPMKQIAAASGFRSVQYFDNVFRKVEGLTPGQYRERLLAAQRL